MKEKEIQVLFEEWLKGFFGHDKYTFYKAPYYGRTRWDIFGIYDYIIATDDGQIYFYQITTINHISDRRKKIKDFYSKIGFGIPNAFIMGWDKKNERFKIEEC